MYKVDALAKMLLATMVTIIIPLHPLSVPVCL